MLSHRLRVAAPVEGFVGFAIGHSIREDTIAAHRRELDNASPVTFIAWNTCATPTSTVTTPYFGFALASAADNEPGQRISG